MVVSGAVAVAATVTVVWPVSAVGLRRPALACDGLVVVVAGRVVLTVVATVLAEPAKPVSGTVIVGTVVVTVVGTLAASEAPRSSVP